MQAAGEIRVWDGQVKWVDNASGHYQPVGSHLEKTVADAFSKVGLDTSGKFVHKAWNGKAWVKVE